MLLPKVLLLLLVYIFNFIDRQVIAILSPAIKADLGVSDTQLGLLKGLAFALLNETLIRVASPEVWLMWCALIPVLSHYVTSGLTVTVMLQSDHD